MIVGIIIGAVAVTALLGWVTTPRYPNWPGPG